MNCPAGKVRDRLAMIEQKADRQRGNAAIGSRIPIGGRVIPGLRAAVRARRRGWVKETQSTSGPRG